MEDHYGNLHAGVKWVHGLYGEDGDIVAESFAADSARYQIVSVQNVLLAQSNEAHLKIEDT